MTRREYCRLARSPETVQLTIPTPDCIPLSRGVLVIVTFRWRARAGSGPLLARPPHPLAGPCSRPAGLRVPPARARCPPLRGSAGGRLQLAPDVRERVVGLAAEGGDRHQAHDDDQGEHDGVL